MRKRVNWKASEWERERTKKWSGLESEVEEEERDMSMVGRRVERKEEDGDKGSEKARTGEEAWATAGTPIVSERVG
eukprot:5321367-Pleurochrysis_carterae.AAC.1